MKTIFACLGLGLSMITSAALAAQNTSRDHDHDHDHAAEESLEKGKHVHGAVTFNLALEGQILSVELDAPALNVVGFEKAPRSDAERRATREVDAWLASGREFLAVPKTAACQLQNVEYTPPKLGGSHADYRPRYTFRCSNPAALEWVELWALRKLKDVEKSEINLVTASLQRQQELERGSLRVSLK